MHRDLSRFSHQEDDRLILAVKDFPAVYNHEHCAVTKNQDLLREQWRVIAEKVGRDENSCKKRWRDIKDHFFKIKRKQPQGGKDKIKWTLFEKLSFLNNVKRRKYRSAYQNIRDTELSEAEENDSYELETPVKVEVNYPQEGSPSMSIPQMEYVAISPATHTQSFLEDFRESTLSEKPLSLVEANVDKNDEDDVDMFMRSVAFTIKKFPPEKRAEAKMNILSIVTKLEFPNWPTAHTTVDSSH